MQSGKNVAATMKEKAANIGASAKSGMEKTKATIEEKAEKMSTRDPLEKQLAEEKKQERIIEAELEKQRAKEHNTAAKEAERAGGVAGHPTSALPGHGTGQPHGQVTSGVAGSHPVGTNTGTGTTTAQNPYTAGTTRSDYKTGGGYN